MTASAPMTHQPSRTGLSREKAHVRCDALGCDETYPVDFPEVGEPGFPLGPGGIPRFLGWVYLDLNRLDLVTRELRFCGVRCLRWWLDTTRVGNA